MTTATENIRFICNSCGFRARIPGTYKGKVILCPGCQAMKIVAPDGSDPTGSTVAVRRVETATTPAGTYSTPDASGKIRFTCTTCGYLAKLGTNYAGKAIACPSCQSPQLIPPLAPAAVAAPKAEIELALDLSAPSTPEAAPAPAPKPTPPAKVSTVAKVAKVAPEPDAPAPVVDGFSLDEPEAPAEPDLTDGSAPLADLPTGLADEPAAVAAPSLDELAAEPPAPVPAKPAVKALVRRGRSATPAVAAPTPPSAAEAPTTKPKTGGVVRRGARPVDEDDAEEGEDDDGTDTPPAKEKVPFMLPSRSGSLVDQLKQPPALYVGILAAVSTVLMLAFLVLWRVSAGSAATEHDRADTYTGKFETESKAHRDAVLERDGQKSELEKATARLEAAVAAGKKTEAALATAESESQAAKADADTERTQRKAAEGKLDAALAKAAKAESERDDWQRKELDTTKALKEETAMRKQFQDRVKELDAKTK